MFNFNLSAMQAPEVVFIYVKNRTVLDNFMDSIK